MSYEVSSIRNSDQIAYLPYEEFKLRYPIEVKEFNKGSYGTVYLSGDKYIVKNFNKDILLNDLSIELNAYSTNIHPCIFKPSAWSVNNNKGMIAMKKGYDIIKAFNENKITIEQIIFDSLSAINFLNSRGIVHGDIKPGNMIFHKGRCKMIDFGLSRKAELDDSGSHYIIDVSYTLAFKDPEYSENQYNNISTEVYSLVASYVAILTNKINFIDILNNIFNNIYEVNPKLHTIRWLIKEAQLSLEKRSPINHLLHTAQQLYGFEPYVGTILDATQTIYCDGVLSHFMQLLITIAEDEIKAETLFLALQIANRTYKQFRHLHTKDINRYLNVFIRVILSLAISIMFDADSYYRYNIWKADLGYKDFDTLYAEVTIDILKITGGVISTLTYWDYANSKEDLTGLLRDIVNCRPISEEMKQGTSKCITLRDFLPEREDFNLKRKGISNVSIIIERSSGCQLDLTQKIRYVTQVLNSQFDLQNLENMVKHLVPAVLHNKDVLDKLDINRAWKLFTLLNKHSSLEFVLDRICKYNWRNYISPLLLTRNLNPLTATDEDFKN